MAEALAGGKRAKDACFQLTGNRELGERHKLTYREKPSERFLTSLNGECLILRESGERIGLCEASFLLKTSRTTWLCLGKD